VKPGAVGGGGETQAERKGRGALGTPVTLGVFGGFQARGCVGMGSGGLVGSGDVARQEASFPQKSLHALVNIQFSFL
jgi:hypothetical protein